MKQKHTLFVFLTTLLFMACPQPDNIEELDGGTNFTSLQAHSPHLRSLGSPQEDWYKDEIFYHLWIPAFKDGNSSIGVSGEGDLQGIIDSIPYLKDDLGVTAIWLSPFWQSASTPANRHNYDATDHYKVNSAFGSNVQLEELIQTLHENGMRVIFDWVPNHVSRDHPWFVNSSQDKDKKREWFIWKSEQPSGWTGFDGNSDFHYLNDSFYYGVFWDGMPDLNYDHPKVRNAMGNVILYWLNQGFDGMRVDAVRYLYEDWDTNGSGYQEQPKTYRHFGEIRSQILDPFTNLSATGGALSKFMVAENWTTNRTSLTNHTQYETSPGFHMMLDFPFVYAAADLNTTSLHNHWTWVTGEFADKGGWMGTFTSNHDNVVHRPMSQFNGNLGKVRAQAGLLLAGVGTPFLYYGNELGMTGYAGDDINLRRPLNWTEAATQKSNAQSLLNWHKALIQVRKDRESLRRGTYSLVKNQSGIFSFLREYEGEKTLVVFNLNESTQTTTLNVTAPGEASTLLGTHNLSVSGDTITVTNISGYGVRILALNDGTKSTILNDIPY